MKKILRYLFFKNCNIVLILLTIISLLLLLLQSLRFFDLIINRGFSVNSLVYVALLTMPKMWVEVLPFVMVVSTIFTWNSMTNNHEITAMRSVGITSWQLASTNILLGLVFSIVTLVFTGWIIPKSDQLYSQLRTNISNQYNIKLIEPGKFNYINSDLTFYVKQIKNNEFNNIVIYNEKNSEKPLTIYAEKGFIDMQNETLFLLLDKASIIERNTNDNSVSFVTIDKYLFDFNVATKTTQNNRLSPDKLYLQELLWQKDTLLLKNIKKGSPSYNDMVYKIQKETLKRVYNSSLSLILSIISVFFFANTYFSRTGDNSPIIKAILATALLKIITLIIIFSNFNIVFSIIGALIIPIIITIFLLFRIAYPYSLKKIASR